MLNFPFYLKQHSKWSEFCVRGWFSFCSTCALGSSHQPFENLPNITTLSSIKSWPATTLHWIRRVLCDIQICDCHPVLCSHHEQEVMSPCADRFRWRSWRLPWTSVVLPLSANWPLWTRTATSSWPPSASLALRGRAPRWVRILAKKTKKKKKSLFLKIVIFYH